MLNQLPVVSAGRQPGAIVRVNGTPLQGWISWEVSNNSFYEADTYRVSFAASALPADYDITWFATQKEIFVEILAGFPSNQQAPNAAELTSLIYGRVDDIKFNPVTGVIDLTGRDLTAVFIDNKLVQNYQNQRASDIAIKLAYEHDLQSVVTTTEPNQTGTYYQIDHVKLTTSSEWDLLAALARQEGFICYVSGQTLYFEPDPRDTTNPYIVRWQPPDQDQGPPSANVMELNFSRALTVAKGVTVTVSSPSVRSKSPVVQSYPSVAKTIQPGKASPFGNVHTL
jgi:hypothetical protein